MSIVRDKLIEQFAEIPEVSIGLWKDTDLLCVFFRGREIAHFHGDQEIDIRLTPKIIKQQALTPPAHSNSHPDRAKNSRWLVQSIDTATQIKPIVELVQIAATLRANNK
jgi:hypothetical protein